MKLLSPAGDFDSLKMAVYNGADEVYLGIRDYNARNNITGFSIDNLKEAVDFAHIFGVKVHLTVNILFRDDEIQSALDLIVEAYNIGVDAFIVQDLGLASLVHEHYPIIEMHASTQMGIHNLEGVRAVESLGFKRVVLSRETPLDEIKRIRDNSNVEIEYFSQGALCVSFSGNCYLSSYEHDASGNRGKCKQLCRLPFTLSKDDKDIKSGYLLSAKDFNMLDRLRELEDAGVTAIKIEGRARRPYYVATATRVYRNALDGRRVGDKDLSLAFNRGFTHGYFNGNSNILSKVQGHNGIEIGSVKEVNTGKRFNEVYIKTNYDLVCKSSLKFFLNGEEVCTISPYDVVRVGNLVKITTTANIPVGAKVNLITDAKKEEIALSFARKREIDIEITALENSPIMAQINIAYESIQINGDVLDDAKSAPLSISDIEKCFNKSEYFAPKIRCNLGNVFMPKSRLNEFRRMVYDEVTRRLTEMKRESLTKIKIQPPKQVKVLDDYTIINEFTTTDAKNIILDLYDYSSENVASLVDKYMGKSIYLNLPNFALKPDIKYLRDLVTKYKLGVVINNVYGVTFNCEKIAGGGMNVYNSFSARLLDMPIFVAEECGLDAPKINMPYMTLRHCPMKEFLNANCDKCPYMDGYKYRMSSGKEFNLKRKKLSSCTFYLTD